MSDATSPQIHVSCAPTDRGLVRELVARLAEEGLRPILTLDLELGSYWPDELGKAWIVVVCLSRTALNSRRLEQEVQLAKKTKKPIIPVFLEEGVLERQPFGFEVFDLSGPSAAVWDLENFTGVNLYEADGLEKLVEGLKRLVREELSSRAELAISVGKALPAVTTASNLLLRRVSLTQIRCFETFDLDLGDDSKAALLTMVLGDNAAGKSTLLRSIALGLSSESDASALIKQLPGPFVRRGAEEGSIRLELCDPDNSRGLTITTRILNSGTPDERVRKETDPDPFPWEDVFVCAYGTNRFRQASASYETYTLHQAVLSLFDDDTVLQNPEVVLLRLEPELRTEVEHRLLRILMLDEPDYEVTYPRTGLEIRGPWGQQPLRSLSDGYRSTAQWVLDFLAWSIYARRFASGGDVGGILIVDELEQHLHPSIPAGSGTSSSVSGSSFPRPRSSPPLTHHWRRRAQRTSRTPACYGSEPSLTAPSRR